MFNKPNNYPCRAAVQVF